MSKEGSSNPNNVTISSKYSKTELASGSKHKLFTMIFECAAVPGHGKVTQSWKKVIVGSGEAATGTQERKANTQNTFIEVLKVLNLFIP